MVKIGNIKDGNVFYICIETIIFKYETIMDRDLSGSNNKV
jgi:hypothetical protein